MLRERPGGLVVAADVDEPAVVAARQRYGDELIGFMIADGRKLPFGDRAFHSIVTLETLEHIDDDAAYVRELARVLHPDGTMVLSTPNRAYSEQQQRVNPYHVREYHAPELLALLQQRFRRTALFYQGFSARYEAAERSYAASIQSRKQRLPLPLRASIDAVYRPLKRVVPRNVSNYFIRRLLGLEYPQPRPADIHISAEPDPAANVFIVVCQEPVPG
jgi:SAM-dependent methyltransferase